MTEWVRVGDMSNFVDGVFGAEVQGIPLAIYLVRDQVFATHDICTHAYARLSEGFLEDLNIECPLHQGMFNVKTGEPTGAPCTKAVRTYPAKLEGNEVFVTLG